MDYCNCEHIRHFPNGSPYELPEWDAIERNGHPYLKAYAGDSLSPWLGPVCDACKLTCLSGEEFDREAYARAHGWTLAELCEFETTYGVDAEMLETKRLQDDAAFKALPPWERAPETYLSN